MFNKKNLHLWLIGGVSFFGFAYASYAPDQHSGVGAGDDVKAVANVPAVTERQSPEDSQGRMLYVRRCGACHSLDANRIGPRHRGVVGREAGSLPDYEYSKALRRTSFAWNDARLDEWLANPEALVPGQKMGFRLGNGEEREQIIAYLKTQS